MLFKGPETFCEQLCESLSVHVRRNDAMSKGKVEVTASNTTERKHIVSLQVFSHVGETFFESATLSCIVSLPDVDLKIQVLKTCIICHISNSLLYTSNIVFFNQKK